MKLLEKLLRVLGDGQWHSTTERFSTTLHRAVKEQGWQMEKRRSDVRAFEYRLVR